MLSDPIADNVKAIRQVCLFSEVLYEKSAPNILTIDLIFNSKKAKNPLLFFICSLCAFNILWWYKQLYLVSLVEFIIVVLISYSNIDDSLEV